MKIINVEKAKPTDSQSRNKMRETSDRAGRRRGRSAAATLSAGAQRTPNEEYQRISIKNRTLIGRLIRIRNRGRVAQARKSTKSPTELAKASGREHSNVSYVKSGYVRYRTKSDKLAQDLKQCGSALKRSINRISVFFFFSIHLCSLSLIPFCRFSRRFL